MGLVSNSKDWTAFELDRLPAVLTLLVSQHPAPERLDKCKPGIYVRTLEHGRVEAYALDPDDTEVSIGIFPVAMLYRQDIQQSQN